MPKYTVIIDGKERTIDKNKFDGNVDAISAKYPDARIKAINGNTEGMLPVSNYSKAIKQGYKMVEMNDVEPTPAVDPLHIQTIDSVRDYKPVIEVGANKPFDIVKEMNEPTDTQKREEERKRIEEQARKAKKASDAMHLNASADKVKADYDALSNPFTAMAAALNPVMGSGIRTVTDAQVKAEKNKDLARISGEKADDTINMIEEAKKKGDTSFVSGFGRGFWEKVSKASTWDFGARDLQSNLAFAAAVDKQSKGLALSAEEDALLDAVALEAAAQGEFSGDLGRGYKAGSISAESLPFMAEFMINPATGTGAAVGKAATKQLISKFGKEAAKSTIGKIARVSARAAGDVAGAAVMAGTTGVVRTSSDAVDRMSGEVKSTIDSDGYYRFDGMEGGDVSFKAFAKAYGASTIENFSEMFGNYLMPVGSALGGASSTIMNKIGLGKVNDIIGRVKSSDAAKIVNDFQKRTQWNGTIGEYLEEQAGMAMNALTVGDNKLSDLVDVDTQIDTFLGVSAFGGFFSGIKTAGYAKQKYEEKKKLNEAGMEASNVIGDGWEPLKDRIDEADDIELHSILSETMSDREISDEQKQSVLLYAGRLKAYHGANLADLKRKTEGDTPNEIVQAQVNFDAGYKLAEADRREKRLAAKELEAIESKLDDEFISADENTRYELMRQRSEAREDVANELSFINAQSRFDGMIHGIRDAIDEKVASSNQYIQRATHSDGNVYDVTLTTDDKKHVYPISGSIVIGENGIIDRKQSDKRFITRDENGNIEMRPVEELYKVESFENSDVMKKITAQSIREQESARYAEEIETPNEEEKVQEVESLQAGSEVDLNINGVVHSAVVQSIYSDGNIEIRFDEKIVGRDGKEKNVDVFSADEVLSFIIPKESAPIDTEELKNGTENVIEGEEIAGDIKNEEEKENISSEILPSEDSITSIIEQPIETPSSESSDANALIDPVSIEQAPITIGIPVDDKGNELYHKVPVETTLENVRSYGLDESEMDEFVAAQKAEATKRLEKLQKGKPKVGTNLSKYQAEKKAWESNVLDVSSQVDYWNEVDSQIQATRVQPGDVTAEAIASMGDPMNAEEFTAAMLGSGKLPLLFDDYKRETGFSNQDAKGMFGLFSSKSNGGMSIEEAGEKLMEMDASNGTNFFDQSDANAGRNTIIDILSSSRTRGDLFGYIKGSRERMAEQERQAEYDAYEMWVNNVARMSIADYEADIETTDNRLKEYFESFNFDEINGDIADDLIKEENDRGTKESGDESISGGNTTDIQGEPNQSSGSGSVEQPEGSGAIEESERGRQGVAEEVDVSGVDVVGSESIDGLGELASTQIAVPSAKDGESPFDYAMRVVGAKNLHDEQRKVDVNPTEAQKEAGNYRMGHVKIGGHDVTIENPKGSVRRGVDKDGKEWEISMNNTYGYFRGTKGKDGDHIDTFLGDNLEPKSVYVVDQINEDGTFDEHKVMYGFDTEEDAKAAYMSNYEEGWKGFGNIAGVPREVFDEWLKSGTKKQKPFRDYKGIQQVFGGEFTPLEELTEDNIADFVGDEVQKRMAIGYLNGNKNSINTIAYENLKNKINEFNRSRLLQSNSGRANSSDEVNEETVSNDSRRNGQSGGHSQREVDGGVQGRIQFDNERSGGTSSGSQSNVDGDGGNVGAHGDQQVQGSTPRDVDSDTRGVKPKGRDVDSRSGHSSDGGGKKINKNAVGDARKRGDRVSSLKEEKDNALNDLKDALRELRDAGMDSLSLSVVGLNARQIEATMKVVAAGSRYGYALVKEGVVVLENWIDKMREALTPSFKAMHFSDQEIGEFIKDMWSAEIPDEKGVFKSVKQWAEENGFPKIREHVRSELETKRERQVRAESVPTQIGDLNNIQASLPFLLEEQHDDVLKAEVRFFSDAHKTRELAYGKGIMFTNGTGTGKTYTGLGIIKRMVKQGKGNVLIVVPSQNKVSDWIKDGTNLGISISALENTKSEGDGVVITTYANFLVNKALYGREFDLVVYDESHRLMENKDGGVSSRTAQHYLVSNRSTRDALRRLQKNHPLWQSEEAILRELSGIKVTDDMMENEARDLYDKQDRLKKELLKIQNEQKEVLSDLESSAKKAFEKTKVLFLSATPFKDHFNLRYAEQYLFSYPEKNKEFYNDTNPEEQFFLENFGAAYKMRYNRIEKSGENADFVSRQEIEFSQKLTEMGVMSGRMINSEMDYSRDFPTVTGFNSDVFNNALNDVFNYKEDAAFDSLIPFFSDVFHDYNYSTKLFEVLKTSASVARMREHLDSGRKIVVFHRRRQGDVAPPFLLSLNKAIDFMHGIDDGTEEDRKLKSKIASEVRAFMDKYGSLLDYEQTLNYLPVVDQLKDVFGDRVAAFNGSVSTGGKNSAVEEFNRDDSGVDILVIQEESGKEGISLHDQTGVHQRVLMNMALPISSITALQIEGRTYRIGNATNAIFEYPLLGLDLEIYHFGSKLNKKLSTTENLAMGNLARDLLASFANGVLEQRGDIDIQSQGTGGKEYDRRADSETSSLFDKAISAYYNVLKRTSKTKSIDGIDYFPTPEPLGLKMVEWGKGREDENFLEPSAGHGAIARWVPSTNKITAIEPSGSLFSKLNVASGGGAKNIIQGRFEDYHIINKHDVIVMNPPFGNNSKMAGDHLEKAFGHLKNGGRLVAIVPDGASMNKRLDKFLYGEDEKGKIMHPDVVLRGEILLPSVTFERAGTSVMGKVVIIDRIIGETTRYHSVKRVDLRNIMDTKSLFEAISDLDIPDRVVVDKEIGESKSKGENDGEDTSIANRQYSEMNDQKDVAGKVEMISHTKTGEKLFKVAITQRMSKNDFVLAGRTAIKHSGYWSKFANGFLFKTQEHADAFTEEANSKNHIEMKRLSENENLFDFAERVVEQDKVNRNYDNALDAVNRFYDKYAGACRTLVIKSKETIRKQMEAIHIATEDIDKYERWFDEKETIAFYAPRYDRIIILDTSSSKDELKAYLWHENVHAALSNLDNRDEVINNIVPLVEKYANYIIERVDNGYSNEPNYKKREEYVTHFFEELIESGREHLMQSGDVKLKDIDANNAIKEILNYINNGREKDNARPGGDIPRRGARDDDGSKVEFYGKVRHSKGDVGFGAEGGRVWNDLRSVFEAGEESLRRKGESESSGSRIDSQTSEESEGIAKQEYEDSLDKTKNRMYRWQEAYQDSMLGLKKMQEAIEKESGDKLKYFEDAYMAENQMSSKSAHETEVYKDKFLIPMMDSVKSLIKNGAKQDEVKMYVMAKHGLERNREFAWRDALRSVENDEGKDFANGIQLEHDAIVSDLKSKLRSGKIDLGTYDHEVFNTRSSLAPSYIANRASDYSGLVQLTGEEVNFEIVAKEMVDGFESMHSDLCDVLWEKINAATKQTLKKSYQSGLMTKRIYDKIKGMFDFYVPLRGWNDDVASDVYEYVLSERSVFNAPVKAAFGRKSMADDPFAVIGNMAESGILQGNRNLMKQKFLNMVLNHPTSLATVKTMWYENVGTVDDPVWEQSLPTIEAEATADEIAQAIDNHEARMVELSKSGMATKSTNGISLDYRASKREKSEHSVVVKSGGKEYVVFVNGNPRAAQAINGLTNPDATDHKFMQMIGKVNRQLASNFTTRNPAFVLSNMSRDVIFSTSAIWIKENWKYAKRFDKNIAKNIGAVVGLMARYKSGRLDMRNARDRYFLEFLENGGETGYTAIHNVEEYKKMMDRHVKKSNGTMGSLSSGVHAIVDAVSFMNRCAENVSRFTTYQTSREMGRGIVDSIRDAKEVTVNFNKKGAGGIGAGTIKSLFLFFNAAVQSLNNLKGLHDRSRGKFYTTLGGFSAAGILLPMINNFIIESLIGDGDDDMTDEERAEWKKKRDSYDNLPEWVRKNNFCLWVGGEHFITIPLPIELRAFYGLGEMWYQMGRGNMNGVDGKLDTKKASIEMVNQLTELLPINPLGGNGDAISVLVPDAGKPFYQIFTNRDFFGKPIYKKNDYNELMPAWTKAFSGTAKWMVNSAELLNEVSGGDKYMTGGVDLNPAVVEHVFEGYFGGMGKTANQLFKTLSMIWDEDERMWRNVPVANRFFTGSDNKISFRKVNDAYYQYLNEYKETEQRLKGYENEAEMDIEKYAEKYDFLNGSKQHERYLIMKEYKAGIDAMRNAIKESDPEEKKGIEMEINLLKMEMIEELGKIE